MSANELEVYTRGSLSVRDIRQTVRRNRLLLLAPAVVCAALAGLATLVIRPTFESEASLQISESKAGAASLLEDAVPLGGLGLLGLGENELDTDISVLRSRRVVDAVVDSLGLHVQLIQPDTFRSVVLDVLRAPPEAVAGTYELTRQNDGSYVLESARIRQANGRYTTAPDAIRTLVRPPASIQVGQPFEMGGMLLALSPSVAEMSAERVKFQVRPFNRYVQRIRENDLRVQQVERGKLIRVEYRYPDPELAAAAVNAISEEFVSYKLATSSTEANSRVRVLQDQVTSYESQLREAEERLQAYQESQLIIVPEEQATLQVERAAQLQESRDAAMVERQSLASLLETARQEASPEGPSPYRRLATFPSLVSNGAMQGLLQSLIRLEDERAALLVRRTPENADVRSLDQRIDALELQLYQLGQNYLNSLDQRIASTTSALSGFSTELRTIPAREIEFARLTRERMLLSEVYLLLQQHLKEAEVLAAIENETGTVQIVDQGIVPDRPVFPNPPIYLALGAVLGLMIGVMAVVGRESLSTRIRSAADAEMALAGIPVLGIVPRPAQSHYQLNGGAKGAVLRRLRLPIASRNSGPSPQQWTLPLDNRGDAYRSVHAHISFGGIASPPRVLVLTSPGSWSGRPQEAANLAMSLAQMGRRTVLIDGDFSPGDESLSRVSGKVPGLRDVLARRVPLDDAIQLVEGVDGGVLYVLPGGGSGTGSVALFESEALGGIIGELRERFDAVVINAPPLKQSMDAALFGRLADATIIFVRSGETDQEDLQEAVMQLQRLQVSVAGVVLSET